MKTTERLKELERQVAGMQLQLARIGRIIIRNQSIFVCDDKPPKRKRAKVKSKKKKAA